MTTLHVKDGLANDKYLKVNGSGTAEDPFVPIHDVYIQDQSSDIIDFYLMREDGFFTLASPVSVDDYILNVVAGHTITTGQVLCLQEAANVTQVQVLEVNVNSITVDCPFDRNYTTSAVCCNGTYNAAVDGSVTRQTFRVTPKNLQTGVKWHITRITMQITAETTMDDGKFGGQDALTRGILLRKKDGMVKNLFNAKTNGELALRSYDVDYADKAPAGVYGLRLRRSFSGADKNGVVIELSADTNDELQLIIQDDLTGNTIFNICAQGHFVV